MKHDKFAFILGRERELALGELKAVLHRSSLVFEIEKVVENVAFIQIDDFTRDDAKVLIDKTAGIVKIFCIISERRIGKLDEIYDIAQNNELRIMNNGVNYSTSSKNKIKDDGRKKIASAEALQPKAGRRNDIKGRLEDDGAGHRVNLGISSYVPSFSKDEINRFGLDLKRRFKENGVNSRFVGLTDMMDLSTIQTLKNKLDDDGMEIGIFSDGVGILWALNDPEKWAKIDYDKPAADKFSGMLPPRLARMMINLTLGEIMSNVKCQMSNESLNLNDEDSNSGSRVPFDFTQGLSRIEDKPGMTTECGMTKEEGSRLCSNDIISGFTILDPFCGSGAILIEGLQLGYDVIGSDVSDKAIRDTKENLEWFLKENTNIQNRNLIFKADATSNNLIKMIKYKVGKELIIVTEPFLGRPKKMKSSFEGTINEYRETKALYLDFFKNIAEFNLPDLKKTLCVIFPSVETKEGKRYRLFDVCKAEIEKMGFIQNGEPFLYGRDYQIVKREIVIFNQ